MVVPVVESVVVAVLVGEDVIDVLIDVEGDEVLELVPVVVCELLRLVVAVEVRVPVKKNGLHSFF